MSTKWCAGSCDCSTFCTHRPYSSWRSLQLCTLFTFSLYNTEGPTPDPMPRRRHTPEEEFSHYNTEGPTPDPILKCHTGHREDYPRGLRPRKRWQREHIVVGDTLMWGTRDVFSVTPHFMIGSNLPAHFKQIRKCHGYVKIMQFLGLFQWRCIWCADGQLTAH